jgi:hypothetical protein
MAHFSNKMYSAIVHYYYPHSVRWNIFNSFVLSNHNFIACGSYLYMSVSEYDRLLRIKKNIEKPPVNSLSYTCSNVVYTFYFLTN